eukprot:CAMPEP_0119305730 /NCGR_PEP_ID=MMETSP1333-20130426/6662_1 /TAXON_ID=418940 /ORGANISM="Scyphosphaera apsteinii, Strain RCC1455" /LENGTH=196 /DNA_ID=CAMNT_0007308895 /DNA_START=71 /DNA_END=661 /DNA_ORIENTATION=-
MKVKKKSTKQRHQAHAASARHVATIVRIRKSTVKPAGGGAFTTEPIQQGSLLGFYAGGRCSYEQLPVGERRNYVMDGEAGGRDAYDPEGRLKLASGKIVNVHGWQPEQWESLEEDGIEWIGGRACWTRFINHGTSAFLNASICTTIERFGRSHAIYANRDILAGEELFFSYGKAWWKSRGLQPADPSRDYILCSRG